MDHGGTRPNKAGLPAFPLPTLSRSFASRRFELNASRHPLFYRLKVFCITRSRLDRPAREQVVADFLQPLHDFRRKASFNIINTAFPPFRLDGPDSFHQPV